MTGQAMTCFEAVSGFKGASVAASGRDCREEMQPQRMQTADKVTRMCGMCFIQVVGRGCLAVPNGTFI